MFPCEPGRDAASAQVLAAAFEKTDLAGDLAVPAGLFAVKSKPAANIPPVLVLSLVSSIFHIRPARIDEAAALSDLCFRSKGGATIARNLSSADGLAKKRRRVGKPDAASQSRALAEGTKSQAPTRSYEATVNKASPPFCVDART
jgi:hypothetical protein